MDAGSTLRSAEGKRSQAPGKRLWRGERRRDMGGASVLPTEPTRSERFEEWSDRHRCLVLLLGLIGFPLLLGFAGAYWLEGSGAWAVRSCSLYSSAQGSAYSQSTTGDRRAEAVSTVPQVAASAMQSSRSGDTRTAPRAGNLARQARSAWHEFTHADAPFVLDYRGDSVSVLLAAVRCASHPGSSYGSCSWLVARYSSMWVRA